MSNFRSIAPQVRTDLGEGPLWSVRQQALWWIDVTRPRLLKWDAASGACSEWPLPKPPASLALLRDGGPLLVFRNGVALFSETVPEPLTWLALEGVPFPEERFNDGKVDRAGRLWLGTMDRQLARPLGQLRSLDGHLRLAVRDSGFVLSNGLGWNADGTTMYFAETHARRIYRYAYDTRTGLPGARSVLVQAEEGPGGPDGLTVDAEGHVWCAMFDRGCVNRYSPDGELVQRLHLPVARPTSCALGGDDLKTLFITTAMHGLSPRDLKEQPDAGRVLAVRVETPGLPEPDFAVDAVREFA